ncbi:MAG: hypothetical protein FD141_706 [Fusobacteria bacterium]|nr:MAG: hypothetical protein FD141_706 [Fusobacteriota bacterium]KAF0228628.1 MAG: hypothetical protein FD182_884 [Fusobacteriota bacterium]
MWFYLLLGIFFIIIGLAVHVLKLHFLISGYNTMSKEKKTNVDTAGLGRLMGIYSYFNGGVFIIMSILLALGFKPVNAPAIVIFVISTVFLLIKAQRYDGNIYDKDGKLRKGAGKEFIIPAVIGVVTLVFIGVLVFFSSQSTKVTVLEEGLEIHGMYGDVYTWESIRSVELILELPTIEIRTNGSALGSNLKGHFRTTELGSVKLFVDTKKPPFIFLETDEGAIIFNLKNEEETQEIFKMILERKV